MVYGTRENLFTFPSNYFINNISKAWYRREKFYEGPEE